MRQTTQAPMSAATRTIICKWWLSCKIHTDAEMLIAIVAKAMRLVRFGRLRCSDQSRSIGPAQRLSKSQPCSAGDALTKQPPASNMNGVVGKPGKTTPSRPIANAIIPATMSSQRNHSGVRGDRDDGADRCGFSLIADPASPRAGALKQY